MNKLSKLMIGLSIGLSTTTAFSATAQNITTEQWSELVYKSQFNPNTLTSKASHAKQYRVDFNTFENQLLNNDKVKIALPLPNGDFTTFELTPTNTMAKALAEKYPNIRTFHGIDINNPGNTGSFDITPSGFHGMFRFNGKSIYIDPIVRGEKSLYHSYFQQDAQPLSKAALGKRQAPRKSIQQLENHLHRAAKNTTTSDNQLRTLRLAVSTTGEYGTFHGGTKESTLAGLVTMVNRVNDVYKQDLGIQFELVANNDAVIYTDAESDPYDNTDDDIDKVQAIVDAAIGADSYDIGHIVTTGGGGLAGFEVVCTSYKAEGLTGSPDPTGDPFYIDYVAHELGHQLGADHTFNGTAGACGGNRADNSAFEPGSASSIMGYAGICDDQDLQRNSDAFFHVHSLDQMVATLDKRESCGTVSTTGNNAPVVEAGPDYAIPGNTPFELKGSATDPNGDTMLYSWEQYDLGGSTSSAAEDKQDDGKRPLFRVFLPVSEPVRTFPKLSSLLANQPSDGEALPSKTREMNFRLVARDNKGNSAYDGMKVNVVEVSEGFTVVEPTDWNGSSQLVSWNTAGTENAPVSCANVDILLSTDSGATFSKELAKASVNDGSQEINFGALNSSTARLKVACSDNIFFAINQQDFTITAGDNGPIKPVFSGQKPLEVNEDDSITIALGDLNFNTQSVDNLTLQSGENYSVSGLTVTPAANYNGQLEIGATAKAGEMVSDAFKVKITVKAQNDLPSITGESLNLTQGAAQQTIDVLSNDSDVDGDTLSLASFAYQGAGTVKIEDNKLLYTPAAAFHGTEKITYTVKDGNEGEANGEVTVTVAKKATTTSNTANTTKKSGGGSLWAMLVMMAMVSRRRSIKK